MPTVRIETVIEGRAADCFDAARDIDLHVRSLAHTGERAVAGRTSGLIEMGERVTWRGRHFGIVQELTSVITAFERPARFQDRMIRGAFRSFVHDHRFTEADGRTTMVDEVTFSSPLPPVGWLVDALVMRGYVRRLIAARAAAIKAEVESRPRRGTP